MYTQLESVDYLSRDNLSELGVTLFYCLQLKSHWVCFHCFIQRISILSEHCWWEGKAGGLKGSSMTARRIAGFQTCTETIRFWWLSRVSAFRLFNIGPCWYCDTRYLPSTAKHLEPKFSTFFSKHTEEEKDEEALQRIEDGKEKLEGSGCFMDSKCSEHPC